MNKIIFLIISIGLIVTMCLIMTGCIKTKQSELKEEYAEVIQLSYLPSQRYSGSGVTPVFNMSGQGGMGIGISTISGTTKEVWAVVLRCEKHNKTFSIEKKELYQSVKVGDKILLYYVDIIRYDKDLPGSEQVIDYKTISFLINKQYIDNTKE
jgi:hypothetical protein